MSDFSERPAERAAPARPEEVLNTAFLVEQDFRRLVETLRRTIATADHADEELVERLKRTKLVADRGLRLSRLLLRFARTR